MVIFLRGRSRQSSWAPAQVQCLIVVNVGAGAEGGESPGTSQSFVATLSPWLLPALLFMPTSLVTVRVKFLLPPVCPLLELVSHRRHILLPVPDSADPGKFYLPTFISPASGNNGWVAFGGAHTHALSLPFSLPPFFSHRMDYRNHF